MLTDFLPGIVHILNANGKTVGTGFIVSADGLILTCSHVLQSEKAQQHNTPQPERVRVVFQGKSQPMEAKVLPEYWRQPSAEDVAILQVQDTLPPGVQPLPLARSIRSARHPFRSFGFPDINREDGLLGAGEILGTVTLAGVQVLQLRSQEITAGFSGAPVWDDALGAVIGMVCAISNLDPHGKLRDTAFAIQSELLLDICPVLKAGIPIVLHNVPELPRHYLPRPADLQPLKAALLAPEGTCVGLTSKTLKAGVQGMGGVGKSVIAAALARDEDIFLAFPDGVVWLTLGQQPNIMARQAQMAEALGEPGRAFMDPQQGSAALEKLTKDSACLLVLDDVWELEHAEAFNVLGSQGRMLLTTRNGDVLRALGASSYSLDVLDEPQALGLLARWAGTEAGHLPVVAYEVARKCGYLPLALAMVGALVRRSPEGWERALRRLNEADLEKIRRDFPDYPYPDLLRAVQVSVDALPEEARQHYLELAVFPEDTPIPLAALGVYWNMQNDDAAELCEMLGDRSLALRDAAGRLILHDLLYDYAVRTVGDPQALHQKLLDAYWGKCPSGWHNGPNDGYFLGHLCYHLHRAGLDAVREQLLLQFSWMKARLETSSITGLLDDYENLSLPENSDLGILLSALRMAAPAVRKPSDLASQLCGHLLTCQSPGIRHFLAGISTRAPWLRPLNLALRQAGDALLSIYRPHSGQLDGVTVLSGGSQAISASANKNITLLDLDSGNEIRTFRGHQVTAETAKSINPARFFRMDLEGSPAPRTQPSVFVTRNTHFIVSVFADLTACAWNLDNPEITYNFENITAMAASADGRSLIIAEDKDLKIWDCLSGKFIQIFANVANNITSILALADGERIVLVAYEDHHHVLKIGNLKTGKVEQVLPCGHKDEVSWESWSSYDTYYDVGGRYLLQADGAINAIALTSDERFLVSASRDKTLKVWDLRTNEIIHTLKGHTGSVTSVAIIPHTLYAVSGSLDKSLKIWDIGSGQLMRTFLGHSGEIAAVAVSPDGKRAISAEQDLLYVWDLQGSAAEPVFVSFQRAVIRRSKPIPKDYYNNYQIRIPDNIHWILPHPGGKQLILLNKKMSVDEDVYPYRASHYQKTISPLMLCELTSGALTPIDLMNVGLESRRAFTSLPGKKPFPPAATDRILQDMQAATGSQSPTPSQHLSSNSPIAISPDGKLLLVGSDDSSLELWQYELPIKFQTFRGHKSPVKVVAMTPDGKFVLSAAEEHEWKLWDLSSGEELHTFTGHESFVTGFCVTPDGRQVLTASADTTLKCWSLEERKELYTLRGHSDPVNAVTVTPDGKQILSVSADSTLKCWSLEERRVLYSRRDHLGPVNDVVVTPDGKFAISGSDDGTVKVWDLQLREACQTLRGHLGPVYRVAVTPDGKHVISAGGFPEGSFVLAWNIEPEKKLHNLMWHFDAVTAAAIAKDGQYAVSASADKTLKVWDLKQGNVIHILQGQEAKFLGTVITPDGHFAVSGSDSNDDNNIKIWCLDSGRLVRAMKGHPGLFSSVNAVAISPDAKRIISASGDDTLKVWNFESGSELLTLKGHASYVNAVAVTADGKFTISASADKTIKVWGLEKGELVHSLRGHSDCVNAVAVTPDGKRIISGSADKTLMVWDLESGSALYTLSGHSSFVNSVAALPGSQYAISASADGNLKVWDLDRKEEVANFAAEAGLVCCATNQEGRIIAGDEEGWIYIFELVVPL